MFHFLIVFRNLLAKHCQSFIFLTLKHIYVLLQPVAKQKYGFDDSSTDGPSISNNLVQVNVYFDSLSEELISSNILYTVGVLIISSRCLNCLLYLVLKPINLKAFKSQSTTTQIKLKKKNSPRLNMHVGWYGESVQKNML